MLSLMSTTSGRGRAARIGLVGNAAASRIARKSAARAILALKGSSLPPARQAIFAASIAQLAGCRARESARPVPAPEPDRVDSWKDRRAPAKGARPRCLPISVRSAVPAQLPDVSLELRTPGQARGAPGDRPETKRQPLRTHSPL